MQVSLRSNCSAHSYFKAWLSVFFPKRGKANTKLPSIEILDKCETDNNTKTTETKRSEIKLSEGKRQQDQSEESQNQYFD